MSLIFTIKHFYYTHSANIFFIGLILGVLFVNNSLFIYPELFPRFLLALGVATGAIIYGLSTTFSKKTFRFNYHHALILFALLAFWIFFQQILLNSQSYKQYLILSYILLFFLLFFSLSTSPNIKTIFLMLEIFGGLEVLTCICQYFKLLPSLSPYFLVTGTWNNPNVTAMFLALLFPIIFRRFTSNLSKTFLILRAIIIMLFVVGLVILKCRSAFLGAFLGVVLFLQLEYQIITRLKEKGIYYLSLTGLTITILPFIAKLASMKKHSLDGRILIWKQSIELVDDHFLTGYGFGQYERIINLFRSFYYHSGLYLPTELRNAGYVGMAYNEFLEILIEGGIVGLIIYLSFFYFLVRPYTYAFKFLEGSNVMSSEVKVAIAGVISYFAMSTANFTIDAIPVSVIFIFFSAVLASYKPTSDTLLYEQTPRASRTIISTPCTILGASFVLLGFWFLNYQFPIVRAQYEIKHAGYLLRAKKTEAYIEIFKKNEKILNNSEGFLRNYGHLLVYVGQLNEAKRIFTQAKKFTARPDLYRSSAICYAEDGNYDLAIKDLRVAIGIDPNNFSTRNLLLDLYLKIGNRPGAITTANGIYTLKPKIQSPQIYKYKRKAIEVLRGLNIPLQIQ